MSQASLGRWVSERCGLTLPFMQSYPQEAGCFHL